MTRVLFLSQAPGVGGGERAALEALARAEGLTTTVVGPEPVVQLGYRLGLPGVALEFPRVHRLRDAPASLLGGRRVRALSKRLGSEVIYANGTRAFPYAIAARVLGGPPLIAHHHGILTTGPIGTLTRALERWASVIIAPSDESARPFGHSRKVQIVRNGVDLTHYRPAPDRDPGRKVVGTVARFAPGKGLESFIRVAQVVGGSDAEASFLLAGGPAFPGAQTFVRDVEKAAAPLGNRLTMTGYLEDPVSAYDSIDIFLHLAEPEGFPLTALEAMACGLPVVSYRWGGIAEMLEDGADGFLVEPRDEIAVAACVRALLTDGGLRHRTGDNARATCEERFSLEQMAAELSAIVRRAAS